MKVIYVAGKYSANSEWELEQNIRHAAAEARKLWIQGWAVICPHLNSAHFGDRRDSHGQDQRKSLWRVGDLELLRRCDAIYMLGGYGDSNGALQELKLAQELGLEVLYEERWVIETY